MTEPDRLWHVFVRSGWIPGLAYHHNGFEAYDLAVLEVFPLAGALAWLPVAVAARLRGGIDGVATRLRAGLADPVRQTDLLAGGLALVYLVVYLPYLPLYATITVRYVVPAMPLLLYGVCRLAPVRAAVREAPRALLAGTVATLGLGGVGFVAVLALLDPAVGEAAQLHALVGLASAVVLGGVVATWPGHRRARVVAGALALATGTTVLFVTLSALVYFTDGHHALDLVRVVAGVFGGPG